LAYTMSSEIKKAFHDENGPENEEHIVDESRLDREIHLNGAIQAEMDKDEERVKKIIRKVDFRMVPILGLLYMWALIDRVNLPIVNCSATFLPVDAR
jgi:hypothetical protein